MNQPLSTIQAGIDKCTMDGDTCFVLAGHYKYDKSIEIWGKSAAAGKHRVLKVWPADSGKVLIDGDSVTGINTKSAIVIGSNGWIVEGFEIVNGLTAGIQGWQCNNVIIRNNYVHHCPGAGIAIWWSDFAHKVEGNVIENNVVHDCVVENKSYTATSWGAGVGIQNNRNGVIRKNRVYRIHGEGILSYQCQSITYSDNVVYDTYATNYYLDGNADCTIERNIGYHTHDPVFFPANPPNRIRPHNGIQLAVEDYGSGQNKVLSGHIIRNNIIIGALHGIYYGSYQIGGGMKNCTIVNNTIYNCQGASMHVDADAHQDSRIANNIFVQTGGKPLVSSSSNVSGLAFDHNGYFGAAPPTPITGAGDVIRVQDSPGFRNSGTYVPADYQLAEGSPCIGSGVQLSTLVPDDFGENSRGSLWDLGAWKFQEATGSRQLGRSTTDGVLGRAGAVLSFASQNQHTHYIPFSLTGRSIAGKQTRDVPGIMIFVIK